MNKNLFIISDNQELMDLLASKNERCFNYLYDNYSAALYTIVVQIIPDNQLACDLLQNVFIKIWVEIDNYDNAKERLLIWMMRIARNLSIDMLHSEIYQNREYIAFAEPGYKQAGLHTEKLGLKNAVSQLKPEFQTMINLVYFKGLSCSDIATIDKLPLVRVKARLRGALSHFRQSLSYIKENK